MFHFILSTRELDTKKPTPTTKKPAITLLPLIMGQEQDTMESMTGMPTTTMVVMVQLDMLGTVLTTDMVAKPTESMPTTTQHMETTELDMPRCIMLPQLFLTMPPHLSMDMPPLLTDMPPLLTDMPPLLLIK